MRRCYENICCPRPRLRPASLLFISFLTLPNLTLSISFSPSLSTSLIRLSHLEIAMDDVFLVTRLYGGENLEYAVAIAQ